MKILGAKEYIESGGRGRIPSVVSGPGGERSLPAAYVLEKGVIEGRGGLLLAPDMTVLRETSIYESGIEDSIKQAGDVPREITRLDGDFLSLNGWLCANFWHWIMEFLPKLIAAEQRGFNGTCVLPPAPPRFITESLDLMGIPEERRAVLSPGLHQAERLWTCESVQGHYLFPYPRVVGSLRDALMRSVPPADTPRPRIYLAREADRQRHVVNEAALLAELKKFGFETIYPCQHTLAEQIGLFRTAQCVLGPHGAGFTNCLFMPPGGLAIELFSPLYIVPVILPVVDFLRLRYFMIPSPLPHGAPYAHGENIEAFMAPIIVTLRRELGRAGRNQP